MPIDKNNQNQELNNNKPHKELVFLKLVIVLAVLLVPLSLILIFTSGNFLSDDNKLTKVDQQNNQPQSVSQAEDSSDDSYNFDAQVPSDKVGDLDKVPQKEIDTLFDNLEN